MSTGLWIGTLASSLATSNDFESIATAVVGSGGSGSISFNSIPQNYQHLQVRVISRRHSGSGNFHIAAYVNGSTASLYTTHDMSADGSNLATSVIGGATIDPRCYPSWFPSGGVSQTFGCSVIDILDYRSTSKTKTIRSYGGWDDNSSGWLGFRSIVWNSTTAITSLQLDAWASISFAQYSQFALYGIKA